jgi:hypothetical protein
MFVGIDEGGSSIVRTVPFPVQPASATERCLLRLLSMNLRSYALSAFLLSVSSVVHAQYDTLFVGQANGVSVGPYETPFPTQLVPSARTQYLYPWSELTQAGMLPAVGIYGVVVDVLDTDPPGTTVDIRVRMKNTLSACLNALDLLGIQAFCDTVGVHLESGLLLFPSDQAPFQWAGSGFNLIVEFLVERNGGPGVDPRLSMDTTYICAPSAYAYDTAAVDPLGLTQTNSTLWGNSYKRPAIGFLQNLPVAVTEQGDPIHVAVYPNPAEDRISLRLLNGPDRVIVRLNDALGADVRNTSIATAANGSFEVPLSGLASGCYVLLIADEAARPLWQQRVVVR